jgi:hypothetical protein
VTLDDTIKSELTSKEPQRPNNGYFLISTIANYEIAFDEAWDLQANFGLLFRVPVRVVVERALLANRLDACRLSVHDGVGTTKSPPWQKNQTLLGLVWWWGRASHSQSVRFFLTR